jgi:hypothetical protein
MKLGHARRSRPGKAGHVGEKKWKRINGMGPEKDAMKI